MLQKPFQRKKHPFSLLEVAIGMALTAILLSFLFSSFRQLIQTNASIQKLRAEKHWSYVAHLRLSQVFETMSSVQFKDNVLTFRFNNGLDPDPAFCENLEAKLFLEEDQFKLLLKGEKKREECFSSHAKELHFSFYDPIKKEWQDNWKAKHLFTALRIDVDDETFTFLIPKGVQEVSL